MLKKTFFRGFRAAIFFIFIASSAWAAIEIEGTSFDDTAIVEGTKLSLNGVGWRKRGYFKVDVTGLYLAQKCTTVEAVEAAPGPKRLQLVLLKEITGSELSRYFLSDFEATATHDEYVQVINEVFEMGSIYGSLHRVKKGDVVTIDVIPGKGVTASINGNPVLVPGTKTQYINSDLMGRIFLRMYIGGKTPAELRANLLGLSHSMRGAADAAAH